MTTKHFRDDRQPALDGLRGIAALFVVFSHASSAGMPIIPGIDASASGQIGVWLFFVLSAFLLTTQMYKQAIDRRLTCLFLADYGLARLFRIFPLYATVLAGYAYLGAFTWHRAVAHLMLREGIGHFWTIPVEMKFYLALPCIVIVSWLFRRHPDASIFVCLGAASLITFWSRSDTLESDGGNTIGLFPYLPAFLCGTAAALSLYRGRAPFGLWWAAVATLFTILTLPSVFAGIFGVSIFNVPAATVCVLLSLHGAAWTVIVMAAVTDRRVGDVLSARWLQYIGAVAFPLYLLHYPLIPVATHYLHGWHAGPVFFLGSLAIAWGAHTMIERPGMVLGKSLRRAVRIAFREASPEDPAASPFHP